VKDDRGALGEPAQDFDLERVAVADRHFTPAGFAARAPAGTFKTFSTSQMTIRASTR
jgi:hypothetical protein